MQIEDLVDSDYQCVSILEDTRQIKEWFKDFDFLVVVNEDLDKVGLVTIRDLICQNGYQV